jgi:hypothetical protein
MTKVTLTHSTIQAAREWFAKNAINQIADVESGMVKVNDPTSYKLQCMADHDAALRGDFDNSFMFTQRGYWISKGLS